MKAEVKERWLQDLRSGEFKQGKGVLRTKSDEFCCLGVLCNIIDPNAWEGTVSHWVDQAENEYGGKGADVEAYIYPQPLSPTEDLGGEVLHTFLSSKFLQEVGLKKSLAHALAELNDEGNSFEALAEMIEERA